MRALPVKKIKASEIAQLVHEHLTAATWYLHLSLPKTSLNNESTTSTYLQVYELTYRGNPFECGLEKCCSIFKTYGLHSDFFLVKFRPNPDCPAVMGGDGYLVPQILSTTVTYVRTEPFPVTSFPVYCWLLPVHFILLPITCVIPSWIKQYKNNYGARIVVEFIQDDW